MGVKKFGEYRTEMVDSEGNRHKATFRIAAEQKGVAFISCHSKFFNSGVSMWIVPRDRVRTWSKFVDICHNLAKEEHCEIMHVDCSFSFATA